MNGQVHIPQKVGQPTTSSHLKPLERFGVIQSRLHDKVGVLVANESFKGFGLEKLGNQERA